MLGDYWSSQVGDLQQWCGPNRGVLAAAVPFLLPVWILRGHQGFTLINVYKLHFEFCEKLLYGVIQGEALTCPPTRLHRYKKALEQVAFDLFCDPNESPLSQLDDLSCLSCLVGIFSLSNSTVAEPIIAAFRPSATSKVVQH